MTIFSFILCFLGILIVIWLYSLMMSENPKFFSLTQFQLWWDKHKHRPFFYGTKYLIRQIINFFNWLGRCVKTVFKFILEVLYEVIFNLILRALWYLIKGIFLFFARIFD